MSASSYKHETLSEVSCLPVIERKPSSEKAQPRWARSPATQEAEQQLDCPPSHFTFVRDHAVSTPQTSGWQRPPTLPQSSRREFDKENLDIPGKVNRKGLFKVFESRFLSGGDNQHNSGSAVKDHSPATSPKSGSRPIPNKNNAKRLLKEAFKLCGLSNFEPTISQISRFTALNDLDGDGVIGTRDLEDRIESLQDDEHLAFSSRSNQGSGFNSGPNGALVSPRNSEKEQLKKSAKDKLGDSGFELLTTQCKKVFQEFDSHDTGYIEYENLLPLLGQVYSLFGLKYQPSPQDAKKYIEIIDSDKDGRISWPDFEHFLMKVLGSVEIGQVQAPEPTAAARSSSQESRENYPPNRFNQGSYGAVGLATKSPTEEKREGFGSRRSSFAEDQSAVGTTRVELGPIRANGGSFGGRSSNHSFQGGQERSVHKPSSPGFSP